LERQHCVAPVVGSNSGRLYEIRFYGLLKVESILEKLEESLALLKADARFRNRSRHYEVAQEAIAGTGDALFPTH